MHILIGIAALAFVAILCVKFIVMGNRLSLPSCDLCGGPKRLFQPWVAKLGHNLEPAVCHLKCAQEKMPEQYAPPASYANAPGWKRLLNQLRGNTLYEVPGSEIVYHSDCHEYHDRRHLCWTYML